MIKEVKIKRNIIMVNKNHERGYDVEKGVMIIEEENNCIVDLINENIGNNVEENEKFILIS